MNSIKTIERQRVGYRIADRKRSYPTGEKRLFLVIGSYDKGRYSIVSQVANYEGAYEEAIGIGEAWMKGEKLPRKRKDGRIKYKGEFPCSVQTKGKDFFRAYMAPTHIKDPKTAKRKFGHYSTREEAHNAAILAIQTGVIPKLKPGLPPGGHLFTREGVDGGKQRIIQGKSEILAELERRSKAKVKVKVKVKAKAKAPRVKEKAKAPGKRATYTKKPSVKIPKDVPRTVENPKPAIKPSLLHGDQIEELKERILAARRGRNPTNQFITIKADHKGLVDQYITQKNISAEIIVEGNFLRLNLKAQ